MPGSLRTNRVLERHYVALARAKNEEMVFTDATGQQVDLPETVEELEALKQAFLVDHPLEVCAREGYLFVNEWNKYKDRPAEVTLGDFPRDVSVTRRFFD